MTEDAAREARIKSHMDDMLKADTLSERHRHFAKMNAEIEARTPDQIERLERARGLALDD